MKSANITMPTRGVDVRTSDTSMSAGAVRSAVNVDIATSGEFSRRRGFALAVPTTGLMAISATDAGVIVHRGGELLRVDERTDSVSHLCAFPGLDPADFVRYNDYLYATNGTAFVKVDVASGAVTEAAVALPARLPDILPGPGSLPAGDYGVVMTVLDQYGEESAAAYLGAVTLSAAGGVRVVGLAADQRVHRFYLTHTNGDIAYLAVEMAVALAEVRLTAEPTGHQAPPLGRMPLPPGTMICGHAGRLYTALRDTVYFSDAFNPHLAHAGHNFIRFEGDITVLEAVPGGIFVGDARGVWFLDGQDPAKFTTRLVSPDVAGAGSAQMVPAAALPQDERRGEVPCPVWMTAVGHVMGTPEGTCKSFISDRIAIDSGIDGRSAVLESQGNKQLVTLTATPWGSIGSAINSFKPAF